MSSGPSPEVEVRRSKRRRRTVSAYRDGDRIVVMIPASLTRKEEAEWVQTMVARLERSELRRRPSDEAQSRWGSCTPGDRTIRLSARLQGMPPWVIDYVLVHELAHLLESGHDQRFWAWVNRFPKAEQAKGYLQGWSAAARMDLPPGYDGD
jgi:predicted metal-dependent hydrolase